MNTKKLGQLGSRSILVGAVALLATGMLFSFANAAITSVTLNTPNGGENWSGTQNITWSQTGGVSTDLVSILLSSNGVSGNYNKTIATGVDVTLGTYAWDTTAVEAGALGDGTTYAVKIADGSTGLAFSSTDFTVDNTAPTLTVNQGTDTGPVQTDTINITTADATSGVASQEYGFSADNVCDASDAYGNAFTSGIDFGIADDHTDYLCAKATDNAGNIGYALAGQLNTDNIAPGFSVVGTTIEGANDTIEVTFDEDVVAVDADWADGNDLAFESPVGTPLVLTNAGFSFAANVLTITLDEATDLEWLKNGDVVRVTPVASAITDTAGNELPTTPVDSAAVTGDVAQPTVALTYSPDREVKEADVVTITATFSEALDGTPEVAIATQGDGDVSATPMTGSGLVWTYDWTVPAGSDDDGTATVSIDTEDLAGNANATATNNERTIDNTAPTVAIGSYTFDGVAADAFFNPGTISLEVTATEPVDWVSLQFQKVGDPSIYKTYPVDPSYDGTDTATQVWDGSLSAGAQADVEYEVEAHIRDEAGNDTTMILTTYTVTVDTTDPTIDTFTKPVDDTVYRADTILSFTASDTGTGPGPVCTYSLNGGADVTTTCSETDLAVAGLVEGRNTLDVTVTDAAGNTDTSSTVSFVYDTDGILTVDDTPANNPDFPLIQEAIDAWVSGITTVDVAAGTYIENVVVDQSITVRGVAGAAIAAPGGTPVTVSVDGVTIDELTIENPTAGYGIVATDVDNLTIVNNTIQNIGTTLATGSAQAVYVKSSSADVNNLTISGNTIANVGNTNLEKGSGSGSSAKGIFLGDSSPSTNDFNGVIIDNNTISNIFVSDAAWPVGRGAYGILANHSSAVGLQITNNTFDTLAGLWSRGIGLENDTPNAVVTGNTISNLTDNKGGTDAVAIFFESNPSIATITVEENKMSNSALGVALHPDLAATSAGVLDATNNWWGDATGPYSATSNPAGLGVAVWPSADDGMTSYVTFSPFYNSDVMTDLVSVDPIASFDLNFSPNPQAVNNPSTLTVTAKDASGYTVVNDTTTQLTLIGDNGASFGSNLLTMGALGESGTTITNTILGIVNVSATETFGPATGTAQIEFIAGSDVTAPSISNIQVTSIGTDTATIAWDTNEGATSQVEFGTTSAYGTLTTVDSSIVTDHSVTITGLSENTVYHFRVISMDASSNVATSGDNLFTTTGVDSTPPVITLLGQNPLTLTVGDTYVEAGATANDNNDGDITGNIVIDDSAVNTAVAGTYSVTYNVSDAATNAAVQETRTVIVVDPAVVPVIPTVALNGDAIVSEYTATEAATRFASGLQVDTTNAASITVNGNTVTPTEPTTAVVAVADANALGLHVYNIVVTSATGDTANLTVSYEVVADFDDTATLAVTGIDAVKTYATADDSYANGWSWKYYITVPTSETQLQMKFSDFISGANTIGAASNIRFYTAQASANADQTNAITILNAGDPYSTAIVLDGDLEAGTAGRQIEVIVEMKVPTGSAGGSYSGSYGIQSSS